MIFSHLRWIRTPLPLFSSNFEELRGPSFSTLGGQPPPLAPLAGATGLNQSTIVPWVATVKRIQSTLKFSVMRIIMISAIENDNQKTTKELGNRLQQGDEHLTTDPEKETTSNILKNEMISRVTTSPATRIKRLKWLLLGIHNCVS